MFHRLAQLAIHADGLHVEMDTFFALIILFEGSLLEHCGASNDCVSGYFVCGFLKNLRGSSVPVGVRMAGLPSVVLSRSFSDPGPTNIEYPWPEACCVVSRESSAC